MGAIVLDNGLQSRKHGGIQGISYKLIFIPLLGYLAYVPLGPFPIDIGGILLSHLLAVFVAFFSLAFIPAKIERRLFLLVLCVSVFLFASFISVAFSSYFELSLRAFLVTVGYVLVTLLVPLIIQYRLPFFRCYIFLAAILVSLLILYLNLFLGWGTYIRFALAEGATGAALHSTGARVDPNMTAMGLVMSIVIYIPNFFQVELGKRRTLIRFLGVAVGFSLIMSASFILLSRTAFVAFVFSISFGVVVLFSYFGTGKVLKQMSKISHRTLIKSLIVGVLIVVTVWWQWAAISTIFERLLFAIEGGRHETGRVTLFFQAIDLWLQDTKTFLIGVGYFTTNPHNEFIRALSSGGVVGLGGFLLLLGSFYAVCCFGRRYGMLYIFSQNVLFWYICIAMLFYGHTKTLWVALMFLLANYLHERIKSTYVIIKQ